MPHTSLNDVDPTVATLLARRKRSLVELLRMLKASIVAGGVVVVRACGEALSAGGGGRDARETAARRLGTSSKFACATTRTHARLIRNC